MDSCLGLYLSELHQNLHVELCQLYYQIPSDKTAVEVVDCAVEVGCVSGKESPRYSEDGFLTEKVPVMAVGVTHLMV